MAEALDEFDDSMVKGVLDSFSTNSADKDVEDFLRHKAINFQKQDISRTYLVFGKHEHQRVLVGYFAIINKPLAIDYSVWNKLSNRTRNRIAGGNGQDTTIKSGQQKIISGILLGQLGKNDLFKTITGSILLQLAENQIQDIWKAAGGRLLWLEANNDQHLIDFYQKNDYVMIASADEVIINDNGQVFFIKSLKKLPNN